MLLTKISDCCDPRDTYHIPVFLFLFPFIIPYPFFWMDIAFLSNVTVHPSSHRTPNDINGAVYIFGKCGYVFLDYLDLVAGLLLYVLTP